MKTMALIAAATLGMAVTTGGAFAASSGDMSHRPYKQMEHRDNSMSTRGTHGAPQRKIVGSRNSTQNATPEAGSSGSLVMPGSGAAIYSYNPADRDRQYGY